MKEVIFIVYSIVHFGAVKQERYFLVTNQDDHACFEPLHHSDIEFYKNLGTRIDTQVVYTKPVVSIK